MNLLLVNYGQADNNSAYHILGHARGLAQRGHDVCVAVSKSVPDRVFEPREGCRLASQKTILADGPRFADGRMTDVLHVWTPRESVRQWVAKLSGVHGFRALVIHLEDNETAIFERFTACSVAEAAHAVQEWPRGLIHPARYRPFLDSSQGITLVHRCLEPLVPETSPRHELVPVMDFEFFSNGDRCPGLREELGIPPAAHVIAFNGNDHAATAWDIRQLYEAVDSLIERGCDVVFVRTGHVLPSNYEGLLFRPGPRCIELGFVARSMVPETMRLADVVIQPGDADEFNSFRLPAKVPEYLAMGKPLVMGACNIGMELDAVGAARILPRATPSAVADAVEQILGDPAAAREMGARARQFALRRFSQSVVIPGLENFYHECLRS